MSAIPVIAIIDAGKTNKKLFLFDTAYNIVFEKTARFNETTDEDGFPCENIESLRSSVFESLHEVNRLADFKILAVNFSAYGASLVYIDKDGHPLTPLYNYLKPYPTRLSDQLYGKYGGLGQFSIETASPASGSLNSGLQLYRLQQEKPELFSKVRFGLHLPQYLSFLLTGIACSDLTSIGCHTSLWDFSRNNFHEWIREEGLQPKLAPLFQSSITFKAFLPDFNFEVGIGLHDSSAALIPYLVSFTEPFMLISTGTWSVSMNPFNQEPLTAEELDQECLCYMSYTGKPVKSSRLFLGAEYEIQVKRIARFFDQDAAKYRHLDYEEEILSRRLKTGTLRPDPELPETGFLRKSSFGTREISDFNNDLDAYYQLMIDLMKIQTFSTRQVIGNTGVRRIFVDGGFGKNKIFMHLLARAFPELEVFAASMAQATALGAALSIHSQWNSHSIPSNLIQLSHYSSKSNSL